eukprot:1188616-Prorocentrum_minimum.AAC.3
MRAPRRLKVAELFAVTALKPDSLRSFWFTGDNSPGPSPGLSSRGGATGPSRHLLGSPNAVYMRIPKVQCNHA